MLQDDHGGGAGGGTGPPGHTNPPADREMALVELLETEVCINTRTH